MLDQTQSHSTAALDQETETYDLVVIGAGIAGLNALYAATDYMPAGARILLVDQKDAPGGMWNVAYDYVRLHQPHPMFTLGDIKWNWRKPRHYLAARDEVQSHLSDAMHRAASKMNMTYRFGTTASACTEMDTPQGPMARITLHPNADPARQSQVLATRAIHAPGLNYAVATPLPLSSRKVHSIIPQELIETLDAYRDAPVIVVGGGKTGMDSVLAALTADPDRKVSLYRGQGVNFINRDKYLPTGMKRWTSGELVSRIFRDLALVSDGDNDDALIEHLRQHHSTDPSSDACQFLYGLQSEDECRRIKTGLTETYADYLSDVVDGHGGPEAVLRSGKTVPVQPGTIVVNCSGSFFRNDPANDPTPILSPKGTVLSLTARDAFHFLPSVSGFFSTHLLYRGQLRGQGFYTLDLESLFRKDRRAWVGASAAQAYMNQVIAVQTLPMMLLDRCGLDLDRWYPLPRRIAGLIRMKSTAAQDIAHCRRVLDRMAQRFDVRAVPLT